MDLKDVPDGQLVAELLRRKNAVTERRPKFASLTTDRMEALRTLCETYLQEVENGESDTDTEHFIFEAAMELVYSESVWNWINKERKSNEEQR